MSIIRWSPFFDQFEDMGKDMFPDLPILRGGSRGFIPAMDVYETKDAVVVESPLAGVDPKDVEISIENNVLSVRGEIEKKSEVEEKDYYRKEVRSGSFYRQVALPSMVDADRAEASFDQGMLRITVPKRGDEKGKTIKVNVKK